MKNISLTIEQPVKPRKFEILDIGDEQWYGSFESEIEFKKGQEVNLDFDNYHGKVIITEIDADKKLYSYVGNGELTIA